MRPQLPDVQRIPFLVISCAAEKDKSKAESDTAKLESEIKEMEEQAVKVKGHDHPAFILSQQPELDVHCFWAFACKL